MKWKVIILGSCLIMLTKLFPYKYDEPFIEKEIDYSVDYFEDIFIFALDADKDSVAARDVPKKIKVFNIAKRKKKISRLLDCLSGLRACLFCSVKSCEDRIYVKGSFLRRVFFEYFKSCCEREFSELCEIIEKTDFSKYDSITVYSYWLFNTAIVGVKLKEKLLNSGIKNIKLISRAHRYDIYEYVNRLNYLPMRETILKNTDFVFPCSNDGAVHICEKFPVYSDKIKESYLGAEDFGIGSTSDDCFNIVTCSRSVKIKRLDKLIETLKLYKNENRKICWTHIGDGSEQKSLKKYAENNLQFMTVHFMGQIKNPEVINYYKNNSVNLFINVSFNEGLPYSIIEAESFGIPIIATDVGGTRETVNGNTGILINRDFNKEELKKAIDRFLNMDADEYKRFRDNSRKQFENNFNAKTNYTEFYSFISKGIFNDKIF